MQKRSLPQKCAPLALPPKLHHCTLLILYVPLKGPTWEWGQMSNLYANDIQSYVNVIPQESLQAVQSMMTAVDQLNDWMKENRLRLNQGKTQFVWIGRGRMLDKIDRDGNYARFPDVEFLTSVNDLGVVLDENLDMDEQIGNTCRSCYYYHLHQIRSILHSLSHIAARMAIQAFVTSRIDYCNAALLGLSSASIDRVQHVMNSAARLLLKLPKFSLISDRMRDKLHWLPVSVRIQFKVTFTMWKCIAGCTPDYLQELCHLLSTISDRRQTRSSVASHFLLEVPWDNDNAE